MLLILLENNSNRTLSKTELESGPYLAKIESVPERTIKNIESNFDITANYSAPPGADIVYDAYEDGNYKYKMEHEYNRYGIYYRLHLYITHAKPDIIWSPNKPYVGYKTFWMWWYKKDNDLGYAEKWVQERKSSNRMIYNGIRYLREFYVSATFYWQIPNYTTTTASNMLVYKNPMIPISLSKI